MEPCCIFVLSVFELPGHFSHPSYLLRPALVQTVAVLSRVLQGLFNSRWKESVFFQWNAIVFGFVHNEVPVLEMPLVLLGLTRTTQQHTRACKRRAILLRHWGRNVVCCVCAVGLMFGLVSWRYLKVKKWSAANSIIEFPAFGGRAALDIVLFATQMSSINTWGKGFYANCVDVIAMCSGWARPRQWFWTWTCSLNHFGVIAVVLVCASLRSGIVLCFFIYRYSGLRIEHRRLLATVFFFF